MKEENLDSMKYRKHTHLAGVDVDLMENKVLTIKKCWYETGVDVSGNKSDGYFMSFVEQVQDMMVNSINRNVIAGIVKTTKSLTTKESRNTGNWIGVSIELYFDEKIKMMGKVTGGIRIRTISPIPKISDANAIKILNTSKSLDELKVNWEKLSKDECKLPTVISLKEKLKNDYI
jgi:hypothetical protein